MSDLVERLRDVAGFIEKEHGRVAAAACLATEAAARIEQLEAALRQSYEGWANALELNIIAEQHRTSAGILRDNARAALEEK